MTKLRKIFMTAGYILTGKKKTVEPYVAPRLEDSLRPDGRKKPKKQGDWSPYEVPSLERMSVPGF